jgi:hypothetical protein
LLKLCEVAFKLFNSCLRSLRTLYQICLGVALAAPRLPLAGTVKSDMNSVILSLPDEASDADFDPPKHRTSWQRR